MLNTTIRQFIILVVAAGTVISCKQNKQVARPTPQIQVYEVQPMTIPFMSEFVGQTYGESDIAIRARVEGFLKGIHFEEGGEVRKGQLLYTIDSQPFEAKVAEQMSRVAQAKTSKVKAESDLKRIKPLAEINAVSQRDLDAAVAQYEASLAEVEAAEASLRAAQIEMSYTSIKSPIDGIIGFTEARVGAFVGRDPNPVVLNAVSMIDKILVKFPITETQYLNLRKGMMDSQEADEVMDAATYTLILANNQVHEHTGKLDFVDRGINASTGTVLVQASFPNPNGVLRPGLYAKIRISSELKEKGIMIPQRCVTELQGKFSVNLVNTENVVERREVELAHRVGNMWVVKSGLQSGEKIVLEGLQIAKEGTTIAPVVTEFKMINEQ